MKDHFKAEYGILIPHKSSGFDLEKVAEELSINVVNIVKAILLQPKNEEPVLCIIQSDHKLSTQKIKKLVGKNYSFMGENNLSQYGLSRGAIPPFIGFSLNIQTYIDIRLDDDQSYFGSGGSVYNACKFSVRSYLSLGAEKRDLIK